MRRRRDSSGSISGGSRDDASGPSGRRRLSPRVRRHLHRGLLVLASLFLLVVVGLNIAAQLMTSVVDAFSAPVSATYSDGSRAVSTDEAEAVAEQIESEGIVLLQNNGSTLPLSKDVKKVNVFGWASVDWMGGGSGSGGVKETKTGLIEALKDYGIETNTELSTMYSSFTRERQFPGTLYSYPEQSSRLYEPSITDDTRYTKALLSNAKGFSDTAIVVLGRLSGESNDLTQVQYKVMGWGLTSANVVTDSTRSTLDLSTEEEALLSYVGANYDKVIVVLNTGNAMAVGAVETISGIDAVVDVGLTGENAAKAIPRVLWGDVSPSGRTTDTWAFDLSTNPSWANSGADGVGAYSGATGLYPADGSKNVNVGDSSAVYDQVSFVDYSEGIYVGYRWYETADAEGYWADVSNVHGQGYDGVVQYPFGYGLSYTTFSWEATAQPEGIDPDGDISFTVNVTNTGSVAGKDVVELYYAPPYYPGGIEKPSVELGALEKTRTLAPGESQEVTLAFSAYDMASYDAYDDNGDGFEGYELEAGDYTFTLRHDAHTVDAGDGSSVTLRLRKGVHFPTDPATGAEVSNRFTGDAAVDGASLDAREQGVPYLSRADFAKTFPHVNVDKRAIPPDVAALNLYTAEMADADVNADDAPVTTGAMNGLKVEQGGTVTSLGLQLGANYFDPTWDPLLDQLTVDEMTKLYILAYARTSCPASVGKEETHEADGPAQIGSYSIIGAGTGFPSPSTLAKTWDKELAHTFGLTLASQALSLGYSGIYAPAINIHRNPIDGRSFEYFSEDGTLTGEMAGNEVRGCLDAGVYCYVKHLVCNDGEAGIYRDGVYTWMTEQTLREIYLKPFRTVVEDYGATGIMTSYNRIGAVWTGGSKALQTAVLRGEWGFTGAILSDFSDHPIYMNGDQPIRAGGSLWMDVNSDLFFERTSNTFFRHLREAAHQTLYMYLNARVTNQGFVNASPDNARWARPSLARGFNPVYPILISLLAIAVLLLFLALRAVLRDGKRYGRGKGSRTRDDGAPRAESSPGDGDVLDGVGVT